jgi:hypothetical protein
MNSNIHRLVMFCLSLASTPTLVPATWRLPSCRRNARKSPSIRGNGRWFVETGMIHTATTLVDGPTTVLLNAMIEADQPLTICVDEASPAACA